ncbi:MAG: plasma membrane proteolipid 3 [Amphiamblys sp. WSBS2006]|nr:MAG: plasma membrane proteolipid 3 [Amphiamblys sp. WSBS2006]
MGCCYVLQVFLCFVLPPVAVCLHTGCCSCSFFLNILLTCLGVVPGIVHGLIVVTHCCGRGGRKKGSGGDTTEVIAGEA